VNFAQQGKGPPTADRHALVNGLKLHYEIHGSGEPLVVLHGGLMTIGLMEPLVTALAESRRVIAVELEGHEYTPLRGEPLSFE
jgi:pimeloyl-ACP methyl ester carboxylesterase